MAEIAVERGPEGDVDQREIRAAGDVYHQRTGVIQHTAMLEHWALHDARNRAHGLVGASPLAVSERAGAAAVLDEVPQVREAHVDDAGLIQQPPQGA